MILHSLFLRIFFFFQAEDGIRDKLVTGVQTCALPIFGARYLPRDLEALAMDGRIVIIGSMGGQREASIDVVQLLGKRAQILGSTLRSRSEERRVGKECRSRWRPYD